MDPDLIWLLSVAAALGSLAVHYVSGRFLSRRLVDHLAACHEDGWRPCGGSPRDAGIAGERDRDGISDYAAWRWLRKRVRHETECADCMSLARSGKMLAASAVSTTFLFLAIAEIWGR